MSAFRSLVSPTLKALLDVRLCVQSSVFSDNLVRTAARYRRPRLSPSERRSPVIVTDPETLFDKDGPVSEFVDHIRYNVRDLDLEDQRLLLVHIGSYVMELPQSESISIRQRLINEQYFKDLCCDLLRNIGHYRENNLIELLFYINNLMPSPNCGLVRAALQMVRRTINEFDLKCLMDLDSVLKTISNRDCTGHTLALVKSLQSALPLATQLRIEEKKFYSKDMRLITDALKYCVEHSLPNKSFNRLLLMVLKYDQLLPVECAREIVLILASDSASSDSKTPLNLLAAVLDAVLNRLGPLNSEKMTRINN